MELDETDEEMPSVESQGFVPSDEEQLSSNETEQEDESHANQPNDDESGTEYSDAQVEIDDSEPPQEIVVAPEPRRSTRVRKPTEKLNLIVQHVLYTDAGEPESYDEAMSDKAHLKWELAMKDEMSSLEKNYIWKLVKLPPKGKVLQNKWIY